MTEKMCGKPENDREKVRKVRDKEGVNRYRSGKTKKG